MTHELPPEPKFYPNPNIKKRVTVSEIESIIVGTAIMAGDEELAAERIYKLVYGDVE